MSKFTNDPKPRMWWIALLLLPFAGVLWLPLFDHSGPGLWGVALFVWCQFLWIAASTFIVGLVCFKTAAPPRPLPLRRRVR